MWKHLKIFGSMIIIVAFIVVMMAEIAFASEPYVGYTYNAWGEAVPSPNGYLPETSLDGSSLGIGSFKTPGDFFVSSNNELYILDSGNERIIILDETLKVKKIISSFIFNEKQEKISGTSSGLFVSQAGLIYVADTGNKRVVVMDLDGNVKNIINKPNTNLIEGDMYFEPVKVAVDSNGVIYIASKNINTGLIMLSPEGKFLGFYGVNKLQSTAKILEEMFWRKIMTKEQIAQRSNFQPIAYNSFDIDKNDFVYTVSMFSGEGSDKGQIKKLNPRGINILEEIFYGDNLPSDSTQKTSFSDITVDADGFINALDVKNGKIFQYDSSNNMLLIFGDLGNKLGTFNQPIGIECMNNKILVLDGKGTITVFAPTTFGLKVREAVIKYNKGMYEQALEPWKEVLKINANYTLAYSGMGEALLLRGDYKEAMKNFKLANNKEGYGLAKKEYRKYVLRTNFTSIFIGLFLILGIAWIFVNRKKVLNFYKNSLDSFKMEG